MRAQITSLVKAKEAGCGFDWLRVVFTSSLVGLCPHCRSCDQDVVCFSISIYHLKSYNDIYTDWSLYHKFVAKISAQTNKKKRNKKRKHTDTHTQAPKLLLYTPACRHQHVNTHKHLQVIVLEFMGHLIYRHTLYVWIQDVLKQKETDCAFNC